MSVVIYTRFSPQREAETKESCEVQEHICRKWTQSFKETVKSCYHDKGMSGGSFDRPLLWQAVADLEKGDILLAHKIDRLARDVYIFECIKREVDKKGAMLEIADGPSGKTDAEVMMAQVLQVFAEYERKAIAARTKSAMLRQQANGKRVGRYAPYGYRIDEHDNQRLVAYEEEQKVLRHVLNLQKAYKLTPKEIKLVLKRDGVRARRGSWFQVAEIKKMIEREAQK